MFLIKEDGRSRMEETRDASFKEPHGIFRINMAINQEIRKLKQDLDLINTFIEKSPNSPVNESRLRLAEDITGDIVKLKNALEVLK